MPALLLLRHHLRDRNQHFHRQQPHAILVVHCEMLEQGYHLFNHDSGGHAADEFGKVVRGASAHHGGVIADERGELLSEARLDLCAGTSVGVVVEASGGDFGGEPVGAGEADGERDEVLFDLLGRELVADFVERLHGLGWC